MIGVTLDKSALRLMVGGGTATLTATVSPSNAANQNVTWTSSDTSIATVEQRRGDASRRRNNFHHGDDEGRKL